MRRSFIPGLGNIRQTVSGEMENGMRPSTIREHASESIIVKQAMASDESFCSAVDKVSEICVVALNHGKKIFIAGNGGSAADAQHFAGELVSRFYFDRPGLAALALTVDSSILTAIGNDYGFERVFARQIQALAQTGDVLIGISTSGNSPNILTALVEARQKGVVCVGLTGQSAGKMASLCDFFIGVPSNSKPRIQEGHGLVVHALCGMIEEKIFGGERASD